MIFHILTAVLVLLKIMDYISISWWLAVAPSLVYFGVLLVFGSLFAIVLGLLQKK